MHRRCACQQWPDEKLIPGFRETLERYLDQVENLSYKFSSLISEAFGLGPDGLSQFYDTPDLMQHRAKIVKYPVVQGSSDQGVGPHYDAGFLTFVSPQCFFFHLPSFLIPLGAVYSYCKPRPTEVYRCKTSLVNGLMHPRSPVPSL